MPDEERRGPLSALARQEESNAPMMAIFGGMFALMLVSFCWSTSIRARRCASASNGPPSTVSIESSAWTAGRATLVIVFPGALRIVETGAGVPAGSICTPGSVFIEYVRRVYAEEQDQIVFFLLEGSIGTMFEARECLRGMWPDRTLTIGWVIADNELLKSVSLEEIPAYIRGYAEARP